MAFFEKFVRLFTWRTAQIGQIAMFLVMVLIVINVIVRVPFKPVPGSVELTEMLGAILLAMGVGYTQIMKGHISVGVLVDTFPPRVQGIVDSITTLISLFMSSLLAQQTWIYGVRMMDRGYTTAHLLIPLYPSIFLVAIGFIILALVLLRDLIINVKLAVKGSDTP